MNRSLSPSPHAFLFEHLRFLVVTLCIVSEIDMIMEIPKGTWSTAHVALTAQEMQPFLLILPL